MAEEFFEKEVGNTKSELADLLDDDEEKFFRNADGDGKEGGKETDFDTNDDAKSYKTGILVSDIDQNSQPDRDTDFEKKQGEMAQQLEQISKKLSHFQSSMETQDSLDSFLGDSGSDTEEIVIRSYNYRATYEEDLRAMTSLFAVLPDVNELSLEELVPPAQLAKPIVKQVEAEVKWTDKGHFVDPITGESIYSMKVEEEEEEDEEMEQEAETSSEEEEAIIPKKLIEDDDILMIIQQLDAQDVFLAPQPTTEQENEKAMANFLEEIQNIPETEIIESNSEILRQLAFLEQQKKLTHDFLNALITRVVHIVEYKDEQAKLRKNLDKRKLLNKMLEYIRDLHIDRRYSKNLNDKVVEYFLRKRLFRNIVEGNVDKIKDDKKRYRTILAEVDTELGYDDSARKNKIFIESKLKNRLEELSEKVSEEIENFENLVRRTFIRSDASEKYVAAINNLIRKLGRERKEVTDFRKNLILRQSLIAELHEQLEKLEYLGEGLTLGEYNHKLTETIGLTKLFDEREYQTGVMRKRCHDALHTVTHMVENISMEKASVQIEYNALNEAKKERKRLREKIYRLKLEHIQILQETASVHEASGLISKPSALMDYDRILEYIPIIRQRVNKLHKTHEKLSERVKMLSQACDNINL